MTKAKIIFLDIETSPTMGYTWDVYDTSVLKILEFSKVISVAWKEPGTKTQVRALPDYKGYKKGQLDDEALVREIWEVLDKADIVVAHYGDGFDLKKLNARFAYYGLNAPSAYKSIDTKKIAKKNFLFEANKLDVLGSYFEIGNKINNGGFDLWMRCISGDLTAWKLMKAYNKQDVELLEKVYLKLRPFISNHPNLSLIEGSLDCCPSCGSDDLVKRGFAFTKTGRRQRYQCSSCGSWASGSFEKSKAVASGV